MEEERDEIKKDFENQTHNEDIENPENTIEKEYEIEIEEKKSFFARFFDKLKRNKEQKLLDCSAEEKSKKVKTNLILRIVLGKEKSQLIAKTEEEYKTLFNQKIRNNPKKDELIVETIGKEKSFLEKIRIARRKVSKLIIPKNIKTRNEEE